MRIFSDIPRNPRYMIMLEPLWALFGVTILYYAPLYMKETGLTDIEIGIVNTVSIFFSFVFHIIAGPVTNKLGRKKTMLVFDLLSWSVAMIIWAVAQNVWYFAAAAAINACSRIVIVAYNCLLVEDTEESKRAKVFGLLNIVNPVFGLLTPVFGAVISRYGTVPALRVLHVLGMISMTSLFIIRNFLVHETVAGKALMSRHSKMSALQNVKQYFATVKRAFRSKSTILLTLVYTITSFTLSMSFFQVIFLKQSLGFSEMDLSLIPVANALISVGLGVLFVPGIKKLSGELILACSILVRVAGCIALVCIPAGNIPVMLLTAGILASGDYLILTYRDAVLMNKAGEHEKADIFSSVQALNTLICIPSGYVAGLAFSANPRLPFVLNIAMFSLAFAMSLLLLQEDKLKQKNKIKIGRFSS